MMDWFGPIIWLTVACLSVAIGATHLTECQADITRYTAEISFTQIDPDSNTIVVNIVYIVYFGDSSSSIRGDLLWQLELCAAENIDGTGTRRLLSPQLLNRNQLSAGVGPGGQLRFEINRFFKLGDCGPGTGLPYICVVFKKHPLAAVEVNYKGSSVITSCEPIPRFSEGTKPEVERNTLDISYTRTDRSSNEVNTVAHFDVALPSAADVIDGNSVWQLRTFASQNSDGTGKRRTISTRVLQQSQISSRALPGGRHRFTICDCFDFSGIGPGTLLPFICLALEQHSNAYFGLFFAPQNVVTECLALPSFLVQQTSKAVVRRSNINISFNRTAQSSRNVVTNIHYDLLFDTSSDVINGNPLWQLKMFASESMLGTGRQHIISKQLLDENEASTSVRPGGVFRFIKRESLDFAGLGSETLLPYVCLSLVKHPSANFTLVYRDKSAITECRPLPQLASQHPPRAVVRQSNSEVSLSKPDPSSSNTDIIINFNVTFGKSSDVIEGDPLWQLSMLASQNIDGTGKLRTITTQTFRANQTSGHVTPGGELQLTAKESVDIKRLTTDARFPYICFLLRKHRSANFEFLFLGKTFVMECRELSALALQHTPRAVIRRSNSDICITKPDPSSPSTDVIINFNVTFENSSDVIEGDPLWQLSMLASQNIDGTGKLRTITTQILHANQTSGHVTPGGELQLTAKESVDIKGLTTDDGFPYICLLLRKHRSANFEILFRGKTFVMECQELSALAQHTPRAVVRQCNSEISISKPDPSSPNMGVIINYNVTFDNSSDVIEGDTLWQLSMFASQNINGTGNHRTITTQMLHANQTLGNITPGGELQFTTKESIDMTGLEAETGLPYICLLLQKHQNASFEISFGDISHVLECQELSALLTIPSALPSSSEEYFHTSPTSPSVFTTPIVQTTLSVVTSSLAQAFDTVETKTCRIWGDPHQKTFDGYGYSFQGEAAYIAVKSCKDDHGTMPDFQIIAENFRRRPSKPVTFIRQLKLEYNGVGYALNHPDTVLVDGIAVTLPFADVNGVKIHIAPPHRILTTNFGLIMRLDDAHNSDVTLPVKFANKVCGICGNFDGIRGNECHYRNTTNMGFRNEKCKERFIQEWLFNTADTPYREHIKPLTSCDNGSVLLETAGNKCSIITDPTGPLAACHPFVSPQFYYETCIFDLCQLLPSTSMLCGHVEAYILECSQVTGGTTEVGHWRDVTEKCERYCGGGMIFSYRGNPCPPTCDNPDGTEEDCPFPFLETCQCDRGTVLDGMRCVNVTDCGCQMEGGRYLSIGEEFMSLNCSESCLCTENRELRCTPVTCDAHSECVIKSGKRDCFCQAGYSGYGREECMEAEKICRIYGLPHLSTFDQAFYSFQAGCVFQAVRSCNSLPMGVFRFQIHVENNALVPEENYTYITLVRLHFRGKTYRIPFTGKVTVSKVNKIISLPFRDVETGVNISKYKNSIILSTDGGLHINLTSATELTIKLPPVYFGKVCGLCGNADGNSTNDKQQPDRTLLPFANSWSTGSCTQMDEPGGSCVVGSEEEATAIDTCSDIVRKDGPFANCYDFRDPTHFYESCLADLCATLPSTEMFCFNANQYLQACVLNGGSVKGDWKKDVEYCSSVKCPEGYTAFKDSCYKYYRMKKTFDESKAVCNGRGGHLVTITSRAENDFISILAEETRSWIGAERNYSASYKTFISDGNNSYTFLPESIPGGVVSLRFGVVAQSSAYIILSPTINPNENTSLYEFKIAANQTKSFIRRCMRCPEKDFEKRALLLRSQENRFFINFHDGVIAMGRYKKRGFNLHYTDENPIAVKYIAFKTLGTQGTWNFYDDEFIWITYETWGYDNFRSGEPSNFNNKENCLETNYDFTPGTWNDHFCFQKKSFVCEMERE